MIHFELKIINLKILNSLLFKFKIVSLESFIWHLNFFLNFNLKF